MTAGPPIVSGGEIDGDRSNCIGIGFGNHYQAIGLLVRQLIEQHRFHDAEYGCVRADAEGYGEDCHRRKAGILVESAESVFQILEYSFHCNLRSRCNWCATKEDIVVTG